MHKLLESATSVEAKMIAERGSMIPAHKRPGIAKLAGLRTDQYAMWMAGLAPLAEPVARQTAWPRVDGLVRAGGWGRFEQAGLMVSGRDSLTPTHYDGHHNIFLQLAGAKRFLLLAAEHTPNLYGFPALHPLDPLSRVDLELPERELAERWPRTRERARGASAVLEAGDVLVMPQGVWHQVHSLDAHNVSINLLFGRATTETTPAKGFGLPAGVTPPALVGQLPPPRRSAALADLAKSVEGLTASLVGPARTAEVLCEGGTKGGAEGTLVRELVTRCLAPAKGADAVGLPSVGDYLRDYFDARRFGGLPMK